MQGAALKQSAALRSRACPRPTRTLVCQAHKASFQQIAAAVAASALLVMPANALTFNELQGLTYLEVKGTGVANTCPQLQSGSSNLNDLAPGAYKLERFCMEPTRFDVKDPALGNKAVYLPTTLVTRLTYTLDSMNGTFDVDKNRQVELKEQEGMDYAAVTVRLPGGETVPFLFTAKQLDAKGTMESFSGDYLVPSYRGSSFMDPKGRGGSTGYDNAIALPANPGQDELDAENNKNVTSAIGSAVFSVSNVDPATGEIAGVFRSIQRTDNDMGAKAAKELMVTGLWYGQLTL